MTGFASRSLARTVLILATAAAARGQEATAAALPSNPYAPPACVPGVPFSDITCTTGFDPWIEQFGADGITAGCGGGLYCPNATVTRAQMAVFIEKAMRGTDGWSPGDVGNENTAIGAAALIANSSYAVWNTALGYSALYSQSYANGDSSYESANTAVGFRSLMVNQPDGGNLGLNGTENTSVGALSLTSNTTGYNNTAVGYQSLAANTTASANTAVGENALTAVTAGFDNTAIGWKAGARGGDSITGYAGSTVAFVNTIAGSYNTFVGVAGSTAEVSNCTAVGMDAYCDATNQVRLGNFFVGSIGGKVGWSALSDARAKESIRDLDLGLGFVLALRPVSFRYKGGNGRTDMGFVAQDVEALLGDGYNALGIGGDQDRTLSLRYTDLMAPMVKAIQEQQARIEAQQATIESRDARIAALEARLAAIEARLAPK